ncbi:hypothetical protein BRARA_E02143 [Brassica rapa]|uniref:Uncharacterized protein n=1 Tax=Brassica campestris TaxID=3711 RepID=A0A397ZBV8_BRACM|nr:hypothetical protein BRARA_E02143 [Brassica rapa]
MFGSAHSSPLKKTFVGKPSPPVLTCQLILTPQLSGQGSFLGIGMWFCLAHALAFRVRFLNGTRRASGGRSSGLQSALQAEKETATS